MLNEEEYDKLRDLCFDECAKNPEILKTILKDNLTKLSAAQLDDLCDIAIRENAGALPFVPKPSEGFFSLEKYTAICERTGLIHDDGITYVPKPSSGVLSFKDYKEVCMNIVARNENALPLVIKPPEEGMQTQDYKDICIACTKIYSSGLDAVPPPPECGLTPEDYKDICIETMRGNSSSFPDIFKHVQKNLPTQYHKDFFLASVQVNGKNIQFIPPHPYQDLTKKDYIQLYTEAVKNDPSALQFVPKPGEFLTREEYKSICLAAVKKTGGFENVAHPSQGGLTSKDYVEITIDAIKHGNYVIGSLPPPKDNKLSGDEYKQIFLAIANRGSEQFSQMPTPDQNPLITWEDYVELYTVGVKNNYSMIEHVPMNAISKKDYEALWITAVKGNGKALYMMNKSIKQYLGLDSYINLCRLGVLNNPASLQYIEEDSIKSLIIKDITPEKLLLSNYSVYRYFPGNLEDNKKEAARILSPHLGKIEHVVVIDPYYNFEAEINDSYSTYKIKHEGEQTIRVVNEDNDLQELLGLIKEKSSHKVNLVLLGHANKESKELASLTVDDMVKVVKQNPHISRVTLFGCKTAQAEQFEQEKAMQARAEVESSRKFFADGSKCGFLLVGNEMPNDSKLEKMLKNLEVACVLGERKPGQENYPLIIVTRDAQKKLIKGEYRLNAEQVKELQKSLNKDKLLFPKDTGSNPVTNALTTKQRQKIISLCDNLEAKFERTHEEYKKQKELYPFLGKMRITTKAELAKLQDSLQKKLVTAINNDSDIKPKDRPAVQGYIKAVHVDPEQMRFHGTSEHAYANPYLHTFYNPEDPAKSASNIARDEVKKDREASMAKKEKAQGKDQPPSSDFKAVIAELSEMEEEEEKEKKEPGVK